MRQEGINFNALQYENFSKLHSFGVPINELDGYLSQDFDQMKRSKQSGIPIDSVNKEFKTWIMAARIANPRVRFAIQADSDLKFPKIHFLVESLRDLQINRFNLITNLTNDAATAG